MVSIPGGLIEYWIALFSDWRSWSDTATILTTWFAEFSAILMSEIGWMIGLSSL